MSELERPNTVAGLVAKHKELCDLRERYRHEIKKLTVDIDHLDACIRLFDPAADTSPTIIRMFFLGKARRSSTAS